MPERLSLMAERMLNDQQNTLYFSVVSLWEISIKTGLGRPDFSVDPALLRRGLQESFYRELPMTGDHALMVATLPLLHRDPFDRLLIAQALSEGLLLLTRDAAIAQYPGPIKLV